MGEKNAKIAMKANAKKKQELEQVANGNQGNPQVEQKLTKSDALSADMGAEAQEMPSSEQGNSGTRPQMEFPEGSESIWDSDSALQKQYGFDIVYIQSINEFAIKTHGVDENGKPCTNFRYIEQWDLSQDEWNDEHLSKMVNIFSKDTAFVDYNVDYHQFLKDELAQQKEAEKKGMIRTPYTGITRMAYADNSVYLYHYEVPEGKRKDCTKLYQKVYGADRETADFTVDWVLEPEDTLMRMSEVEHELSHREDEAKFGIHQYDLPPKYMAKLDMLSEIKANMVQASYALDIYNATGETKYFDALSLSPEHKEELLTTIIENPDMKNRQEYMAKFIYDRWLDKYNHADTVYSDQAYEIASPKMHTYPIWALEDNPEALAKFHERADGMFANVMGLGDVREVINPDIELNVGLDVALERENLMIHDTLRAIMTQDAENAAQYMKNLKNYLAKVKQLDADGVRTPEELAQLNDYLQEITNPTPKPQHNDFPDMATTAAMRKRDLER